MAEHPRAFALLSAQLRAYGGKIVPNVVGGHNVTEPNGSGMRFRGTDIGEPGRAALLDFLRGALRHARNPIQPRVRFELVEADPNDGEPAGMLGILDTTGGDIIAWTLPSLTDAVIAGIRDNEITEEN